jgi:hypothetical protein
MVVGRGRMLVSALLVGALCGCTAGPKQRRYVPDRDGAAADPFDRDDGRKATDRAAGEREPSDGLPPHWVCNPLYYNTRDGCDCGCGIPDPDCNGAGCAPSACNATGCAFCHYGETGEALTCGATPPPPAWSCESSYYDDGYCDCGCGAPDIDCDTGGCTFPGCVAAGCSYCWQSAGEYTSCGAD